jgi:hypothetical protein
MTIDDLKSHRSDQIRVLNRVSELLRHRTLADGREQRAVDRLGDRDRAIERYGDYAGRIELSETDGLSCEPSASGHFDLHESANVDWSNRVQEYLLLGSEA